MFYSQGHNIFAIICLVEHCSVCVISTKKKARTQPKITCPKPATETPEKAAKHAQNQQ